MAIDNCPECGQQISDKAKKCIHCGKMLIEKPRKTCSDCGKEIDYNSIECPYCGCPIEETIKKSVTENITSSDSELKKNRGKIILPILLILFFLSVIGFTIYNIKVLRPKKIEAQNKGTYNEALDLLEKGKYDEGKELLETIPEYKDVNIIQEQIKYESRVFECVKSIKQYLKNPDSMQIYEAIFFSKEFRSDINVSDGMKEALNELIASTGKEPICLMHYGAQNGFGGIHTEYAMFVYGKSNYILLGTCDTLDVNKVDKEDKDICTMLNTVMENFQIIGDVDIDRIKTILRNQSYSAIKIIE